MGDEVDNEVDNTDREIALGEFIKALGDGFASDMDAARKSKFNDVYVYLAKKFDIAQDIKELHDSGAPILEMLKEFYGMGFYAGVNFMLNLGVDELGDDIEQQKKDLSD